MSDSLAVFHGRFGRVCLYNMDRCMVPHGHREGHLIFHLQGPPGLMNVNGKDWPIAPGQGVAVNPWLSHYYQPMHADRSTLALVLYIRPAWFLDVSRRATASLAFGRVGVEVTDDLARLIHGTASAMLEEDGEDPSLEDRLCDLTRAAYEQSWQWTPRGSDFTGPALPRRDYRIRKALKVLQEGLGQALEMDRVAREVGLSRPHFYKLFRAQVGLTPNLYLNALRMEQAIDMLATSEDGVADIGFDLGFSSQASFSRFFIGNGVVPPSAYRRSVHVA